MKEAIDTIIKDYQNDIDAYLEDSSIPMENYQFDINFKLDEMRMEISKVIRDDDLLQDKF
jgi:hypothetical protein